MIQAEVDGIKSQYEQTVSQLTKEKELAEERNAKLQKQLEKLKNAPKQASQILIDLPLQTNIDQSRIFSDEETVASLHRQIKNLKQEVDLLQSENEKLVD